MKKTIAKFLLIVCVVNAQIQSSEAQPKLNAVYNAPATAWDSEVKGEILPTPIGNGYIGGMIYGGVHLDVIQFNEHSLWSGGPGKNPDYNGGHIGNSTTLKQNLQKARQTLQNEVSTYSATKDAYLNNNRLITNNFNASTTANDLVNSLKGTKADFGAYQSMGNINISYPEAIQPEIVNIDTDCNNDKSDGEKVPMLFDGKITTKWFADKGLKGFPCYISWEYDAEFATNKYSVSSANDVEGRDPKEWKLYGSTDGSDYVMIDHQTNVTFSGRRETLTFNMEKTEKYKFFKFEILSVRTEGQSPQLSEIALDNADISKLPAATNYKRMLDVDNSVVNLTYSENDVNFLREYFASYPDKVMVIRLTASKGKLSRAIWITTPQTKTEITAQDNVITMTGYPADHKENKGLKFAQQIKVIPQGGTITTSDKKIIVNDADEILILIAAATNYKQCTDNTFNYFNETDPLEETQNILANAATKSYAELLETHKSDYKSLYDRMSLSVGNITQVPEKTTDKLVLDYGTVNTASEDIYLEMLYYQFGRYLLISSSRDNSLPANLQGIWADGLTPPWNSDYHTNINVQMNYWLAEQTNLSECHIPMINYINSLVPRGEFTAKYYHCKPDGGDVRGWAVYHENNIWGNTAPGTSGAFYFPSANGWLCQDIWEHYQFSSDKEFLEKNYNTMLGAALFWVDNLWTDTRDKTLVANPSYSPEHGPFELGTSSDQAIICELFDMVIKASEILGKTTPEVEEIKAAKSKLSGPKIGLGGQFMEWKEETSRDVSGDGAHRHVNHLFWLHPGSQIVVGRSAQEDAYATAMKKTLDTRGDGGTGWSKAWKINFWARLHDGNRSHKLVTEILKESTLSNLFDTHSPFQIDGNFGSTSGMTEMLLQSQGDCIELLPSLPDIWNTGNFKGVRARGNFEVNAEWKNGKLSTAEITSVSGNPCVIKYAGMKGFSVKKKSGEDVSFTTISNDKISFNTEKGVTYVIVNTGSENSISFIHEDQDTKSVFFNDNELYFFGYSPEAAFCLYDIMGRKLTKYHSVKNELTSALTSGTYIVKVQDEGHTTVHKIIVK